MRTFDELMALTPSQCTPNELAYVWAEARKRIDGSPEAQHVADAERLDCLYCGGSGHRGDVRIFSRNAFGLACTVAWTELVQAMRKDGHTVLDKSGPETRKWMEAVIRDTFAPTSNAALVEALRACVELMRDLPTLNGLHGLAIVENAQAVLDEHDAALRGGQPS